MKTRIIFIAITVLVLVAAGYCYFTQTKKQVTVEPIVQSNLTAYSLMRDIINKSSDEENPELLPTDLVWNTDQYETPNGKSVTVTYKGFNRMLNSTFEYDQFTQELTKMGFKPDIFNSGVATYNGSQAFSSDKIVCVLYHHCSVTEGNVCQSNVICADTN